MKPSSTYPAKRAQEILRSGRLGAAQAAQFVDADERPTVQMAYEEIYGDAEIASNDPTVEFAEPGFVAVIDDSPIVPVLCDLCMRHTAALGNGTRIEGTIMGTAQRCADGFILETYKPADGVTDAEAQNFLNNPQLIKRGK